MNQIDFVIPWVDGSDPAWQEKKKQYEADRSENADNQAVRYLDWETLKYWFRGVEKFAPWVHQVFFITDGQVPEWLNIENKKLRFVCHRDYIPEKYLPVYNSNPIEMNVHRIPDLSEQFVLFNDDVFLTQPVSPEDFFKNGLPCGSAVESPVTPNDDGIFSHILLNNIALLNMHYRRRATLKKYKRQWVTTEDKKGALVNLAMGTLQRDDFFGFEYSHLTSSILKSTMEKVWAMNEKKMDETCSHRFRDIRDVNQYIFLQEQYVTGKFAPYNWRKAGKAFHFDDSNENQMNEMLEALSNQTYKMICLNDCKVSHFEATKEQVLKAFERILPEKSSFEK